MAHSLAEPIITSLGKPDILIPTEPSHSSKIDVKMPYPVVRATSAKPRLENLGNNAEFTNKGHTIDTDTEYSDLFNCKNFLNSNYSTSYNYFIVGSPLDNLQSATRRILPEEESLTYLNFASRRGMPFAHRYTAHERAERPESAVLKGIKDMVALEEESKELTDTKQPRCQSAIDTSLIDRVASRMEMERERIVETPIPGFRQPVIYVEPNAGIVAVPNALSTSAVPPSSPRGKPGADFQRMGSLLVSGSKESSRKKVTQDDHNDASTINEMIDHFDETVNVRATPVPISDVSPRPESHMYSSQSYRQLRVGSAPPGGRHIPQQHSFSTATRMQKQRKEFHAASRASSGFKDDATSKTVERNYKFVDSVNFDFSIFIYFCR